MFVPYANPFLPCNVPVALRRIDFTYSVALYTIHHKFYSHTITKFRILLEISSDGRERERELARVIEQPKAASMEVIPCILFVLLFSKTIFVRLRSVSHPTLYFIPSYCVRQVPCIYTLYRT